jgi:hypothetical protein
MATMPAWASKSWESRISTDSPAATAKASKAQLPPTAQMKELSSAPADRGEDDGELWTCLVKSECFLEVHP